ncbi:hypothetical protein C5Y97_15865 [Blastopirellula marina]|uniref:Carboxypeptidase regulatory-like domain-containing protein n=2 Tax=Blastopirellula marina TaxID=124 RepID=A0A2S8FNF4_9BACT|nr:hypothetical protein C5Y98_15855 [Blastopirellula marina]PTL43493.1 hypothetical protein C5Y97_15865 [Blastopirellula marina]
MKCQFFTRLTVAILCLFSIGMVGCSEAPTVAEVDGRIALDGSPVSTGVILLQDDVNGTGGSAVVENGSFTFSTPIPPGNYAVALQSPPPPAPHETASQRVSVKFPRHLTEAATSGVKVEITPGKNSLKLDVKSKK